MSKEAMKLALEALEWINRVNAMDFEYQRKARESLNAIYEALAEQPAQQEPVFWYKPYPNGMYNGPIHNAQIGDVLRGSEEWIPLYTSPPAQQEPVAEVVMAAKPPNASLAWLPFKIVHASLEWLDSVPVGTKLYTSPPASKPWADKCRIELVNVIHFLASDFENALGAFRGDTEARRKAEGDIAHARSIASRWNWNGTTKPASKPLTDEEIWDEVKAADLDWQTGWSLDEDASNRYITFARAIEAAHGIKENT